MADDEFGDGDLGFFSDEDDYFYVEDAFAAADGLAETQVPSPGYAGNNYELELNWYEFDIFDYFADQEYGVDAYWDAKIKPISEDADTATVSKKRKRAPTLTHKRSDKRRKITKPRQVGSKSEDSLPDNVIPRSSMPKSPPRAPSPDKTKAFALFPDWRERFPSNATIVWSQDMPEEMKAAAESKEEDGSEYPSHKRSMADASAVPEASPEDAGGGLDIDDDDDDDADGEIEDGQDIQQMLSSLDPQTLRAILKEKLGTTGLDEDAFMSTIAKMLSGSGSADDAAGELARALLGKEEGEDSAALDWLQGQGVNVEADEKEDGENGNVERVDSGAGLTKANENEKATASSPTKTKASRKRKGRDDANEEKAEIATDTDKPTSRRSRGKKARVATSAS